MKIAPCLAIAVCFLWGCSGKDPSAESGPAAAQEPAATTATEAGPSVAAAPAVFAGTRWQLVEMQSMDDAQGTARPDDPAKYTLTFGADGRVAARLDCNRGTGSWKAEPASADSGSIEFGPLAVTRALCPEPSLGERLAAQLGYVRGYLLKDGRLNLSLMADGGILVFEPDASAR